MKMFTKGTMTIRPDPMETELNNYQATNQQLRDKVYLMNINYANLEDVVTKLKNDLKDAQRRLDLA